MAAKIHDISSIGEVRRIVKDAEIYEEHNFHLHEDTALNNARQLWGIVSNTGCHGVFLDNDLLAGKDEEFHFVQQKLEELRRLVEGSDKRIGKLVVTMSLGGRAGAGGPGLPCPYHPRPIAALTPT